MFIELADSYDGTSFYLNVNFIKSVRNNGKYTLICTANTQYLVCETYAEVVKKIEQANDFCSYGERKKTND